MSFPYLPLLNDTTLAIQLVAPFYHPGPANELFMNTHTTVIVKHIIIWIMMMIITITMIIIIIIIPQSTMSNGKCLIIHLQ